MSLLTFALLRSSRRGFHHAGAVSRVTRRLLALADAPLLYPPCLSRTFYWAFMGRTFGIGAAAGFSKAIAP
jgi:hypothetical protein